MGLFSKRPALDDEDTFSGGQSTAPKPAPPRPPPRAEPKPAAAHLTEALVLPVPSAVPAPAPEPRFGIEDAMRLLRQLPDRNSEAVRLAVQRTLEALKVNVGALIDGAAARDAQLYASAEKLQREVEQHEAMAKAAKQEIAQLERTRTELDAVKAWLLERAQSHEEPVPLDRRIPARQS